MCVCVLFLFVCDIHHFFMDVRAACPSSIFQLWVEPEILTSTIFRGCQGRLPLIHFSRFQEGANYNTRPMISRMSVPFSKGATIAGFRDFSRTSGHLTVTVHRTGTLLFGYKREGCVTLGPPGAKKPCTVRPGFKTSHTARPERNKSRTVWPELTKSLTA